MAKMILIGDRVWDETEKVWTVDFLFSLDAPPRPDTLFGFDINTSTTYFYSQRWLKLAKDYGLEDWFTRIGIIGEDINEIIRLNDEDYVRVNEAYMVCTAFSEEDNYAGPILRWLRFWIKEALQTCESPVMLVAEW